MGIDKFYQWLRVTQPDCFIKDNHTRIYNYIYIDINYLLHTTLSYNSNLSESSYIEDLYKNLDVILSNYIPTKRLILSVDGSSPYAKVLLQRKRRENTPAIKNPAYITGIHLTPGTEFMKRINGYLDEYGKRVKSLFKLVNLEVDIIHSTEPNEGEIKLFKKLLEYGSSNISSNNSNNSSNSYTHLVIGNDSDLVLLAMAATPVININILVRLSKINMLLDIKKLISKTNNRSDFVILSLMAGNDYLPKLKYTKFKNIWAAYNKTVNYLDNSSIIDKSNTSINNKFMLEYFIDLRKSLSKKYRVVNILNYNHKKVLNYLEGIMWCYGMYSTGVCSMYDYVYRYKSAPEPTDILIYMICNSNTQIKIPVSNSNSINSSIYTLLVLPKSCKQLIPEKYHKLIDNELKYLYEVDDCKVCNRYKALQDKSEADKLLYKDHKKIHVNKFTAKDIKKIVNLTL